MRPETTAPSDERSSTSRRPRTGARVRASLAVWVVASVVLAGAVALGTPTSAATYPTSSTSLLEAYDTWADGSGRLVTAWVDWTSTQRYRLHVARAVSGSDAPDTTFGTGGLRTADLVEPGEDALMAGFGFTSDGTIVVTWYRKASADTYTDDLASVDRYDLAPSRLTRASFTPPPVMYCEGECGGVVDNPSFLVLDNGAVAARTKHWVTDAAGTGQVELRRATDAGLLGRVPLASRLIANEVIAYGADGAIVNTLDRDATGAYVGRGSAYTITGWSTVTPLAFGGDMRCALRPGSGADLLRTCTTGTGLDVAMLSPTGTVRWSRSIPNLVNPWLSIGMLPSGKVGGILPGCVAETGTCDRSANLVLVRFGATGAVERTLVGPRFPTGRYLYEATPPVEIGGGRVAGAVSSNSTTGGAGSIVTFVGAPTALPGVPPNVTATPGPRSVTVRWSPASANGTTLTGYRIRVLLDGSQVQVIDVGNVTSRVVSGLTVGRRYSFTVEAVSTAGQGPASTATPLVAPVPGTHPTWTEAHRSITTDLTGVPPTSAEVATWVPQLTTGAKTGGDLVVAIRAGTDHTTRVDPAARLYKAYFRRLPDAGGLDYWVAQRRSGRSLASISDSFSRSPEFRTLYGSLTDRQFVELIYTNILGRPGEPAGVDYWTAQLTSRARTRGQVMIGFSESPEFRTATAAEVTVAVLHILLLDRAPTAAETTSLVAALRAGTTTPKAVADGILASAEYGD